MGANDETQHTAIDEAIKALVEKYKEASYWQRHYEVAAQQMGGEWSQRNRSYYAGEARAYEEAIATLTKLIR